MKKSIKTITLGALIAAGACQTSIVYANRLATFTAWAKKSYGFQSQYDIYPVPGLLRSQNTTAMANQTPSDKYMLIDEEYIENQDNHILALGTILHEHLHLDEDHGHKAHLLETQLHQGNASASLIKSKLYELSRSHEERADTILIKPHESICIARHKFFLEYANKEVQGLRQQLLVEKKPLKHARLSEKLEILTSGNQELMKSLEAQENQTHPFYIRRALYTLNLVKNTNTPNKSSYE